MLIFIINKAVPVNRPVTEQRLLIETMQSELSKQINTNRQSGSKEKVAQMCKDIEQAQYNLLMTQTDNFVDTSSNLDYLYTLAFKFSQILRKIDKEQV